MRNLNKSTHCCLDLWKNKRTQAGPFVLCGFARILWRADARPAGRCPRLLGSVLVCFRCRLSLLLAGFGVGLGLVGVGGDDLLLGLFVGLDNGLLGVVVGVR